MQRRSHYLFFLLITLATSCGVKQDLQENNRSPKTRVIFDTDANNELDDQHALAYLLSNGKTFDVAGVTVNATSGGGDIEQHFMEAERILQLYNVRNAVPLYKGANGSFQSILPSLSENNYDGSDAVNFIIKEANRKTNEKLVLIAVGKLTNVALAVKKDPTIVEKIRLVWLGSNYPEPGEYNQDNDTVSMNYLLNTSIPFEMVTVRYGKPGGTDEVKVTKDEIQQRMPGLGPKAAAPIEGRHSGAFENFGDYSVNLFQHIGYHDNDSSRALFDMVAVAVVKQRTWGEPRQIPAPILINNVWRERPANKRTIIVWENFNKEEVLKDFFKSMKDYELVGNP
jgi:purine nucleosidase